jgi:hypothetical protein
MKKEDLPEFIDPKQYPDFWEQMKGFKNFISDVGQTIASGTNPILDEDFSQKRLDICNECNQFNVHSKRCYLCGCFMEHKVKFKDAECPMNMW